MSAFVVNGAPIGAVELWVNGKPSGAITADQAVAWRAVAVAVMAVEAAKEAKAAALSLPTVLRDRKTDEARYRAINEADSRLNKAQAEYRAAVAALRALETQR